MGSTAVIQAPFLALVQLEAPKLSEKARLCDAASTPQKCDNASMYKRICAISACPHGMVCPLLMGQECEKNTDTARCRRGRVVRLWHINSG
jgi:hypothetical protein